VTNAITLTGSAGAGLTLDSNAGTLTLNGSYLFLTDCATNGLSVATNPAASVTANLYHCQAHDNIQDGFSILSGNSASKKSYINLYDCKAYNHDTAETGGGLGDGVTCHDNLHYIHVSGGQYYDNGKSGISVATGRLSVLGAEFWGNGFAVNDNGDIYVQGTSIYCVIDGCTFRESDATNASRYNINLNAVVNVVRNCRFLQPTATNGDAIYLQDGFLVAENNVFDGYAATGKYCINQVSVGCDGGSWTNNTFVNNRIAIRMREDDIVLRGNLFANNPYGAISLTGVEYLLQKCNGYNLFYGNESIGTDFRDGGSTDQYQPTDLQEVNPNLDSNYRPRNRTIARMGIGAVAPTAQTLGGAGIFEIAP
jgi:hypothetical protein